MEEIKRVTKVLDQLKKKHPFAKQISVWVDFHSLKLKSKVVYDNNAD